MSRAVTSFTDKYQKHNPCSFCYQIVSFALFTRANPFTEQRSEDKDVAQILVEMLEDNIKNIHIRNLFSLDDLHSWGPDFSSKQESEAGFERLI